MVFTVLYERFYIFTIIFLPLKRDPDLCEWVESDRLSDPARHEP